MIEIIETYTITPLKKIADDRYECITLVCDNPSPFTGRIYKFADVEKCCIDLQQQIDNDSYFGTIDHHIDNISIDKISHKITKLNLSPAGELSVEIQILKTPVGNFLKLLLEAEIEIYLTIAGSGFVDNNNVVSALYIRTFNAVSLPKPLNV